MSTVDNSGLILSITIFLPCLFNVIYVYLLFTYLLFSLVLFCISKSANSKSSRTVKFEKERSIILNYYE